MIVECPGCKARYDVSGRPAGTNARCRCGTTFRLPEPTHSAGALTCPKCGAGVAAGASSCEFCNAELLVKACPRCFARLFHGHEHCSSCGAQVGVPANVAQNGEAQPRGCPRCEQKTTLTAHMVGDFLLDECGGCRGVWVDRATVERIVSERRQSGLAELFGMQRGLSTEMPAVTLAAVEAVVYRACPDCQSVMNRVNFGRSSGIIVDVCRNHGTWFDHSELPRVVDFVSRGGLEKADARRAEELAEKERKARVAMISASSEPSAYHDREKHTLLDGLIGVLGSLLLR